MSASFVNTFLLLVVLINMFIMGSNRIIIAIKAVAFQGIILAFLAFFSEEFTAQSIFLFLAVVSIKGFIVPLLLIRATKLVQIGPEMRPLIAICQQCLSMRYRFFYHFTFLKNYLFYLFTKKPLLYLSFLQH